MQPRRLTPEYSVSPQITAEDVAAAKAQGFKAIINNRPEGEVPDQTPGDEIAATAAKLGLGYRHVPIVTSALKVQDIEDFSKALEELEGPVLAYCRSGTRSTLLWALSQAGSRDLDEILGTAARAGYDLSTLRPQLEAWAAQKRRS